MIIWHDTLRNITLSCLKILTHYINKTNLPLPTKVKMTYSTYITIFLLQLTVWLYALIHPCLFLSCLKRVESQTLSSKGNLMDSTQHLNLSQMSKKMILLTNDILVSVST